MKPHHAPAKDRRLLEADRPSYAGSRRGSLQPGRPPLAEVMQRLEREYERTMGRRR